MGTMSGKGVEVVEMMKRMRLEVLCVQDRAVNLEPFTSVQS